MTLPLASARQLELAQRSYERCRRAPEFFATFYQQFLASDPTIPPYFARTEFPRQHKLLEHGLGLLLIYAKRPNPHLLERIAARHGPGDLDIPAHLYPLFVDSLLETVRIHDPECDPVVEEAWRAAVAPGIAFLRAAGR